MKKPIGLDTNALLNFRLKRNPAYDKVFKLFQECSQDKIQIYLSLPVILEAEWVLRSVYKQSKEEITPFLEELLSTNSILIDNKNELIYALKLYQDSNKIKFTDAVILSLVQAKGYEFLTFDRNLEKVHRLIMSE